MLEDKLSNNERQINNQKNQLQITNENFLKYKRDNELNIQLLNEKLNEVLKELYLKITKNLINFFFYYFLAN